MFLRLGTFLSATIVFASAVTEKQIDNYLDKCIDSKHHKEKPGPESDEFKHCKPWKGHSCCKANTTRHIANDGAFTLYRMKWNQCDHVKPLSAQCKRSLEIDTCFYECSPNMSPWIVKVTNSKTRRERFLNVPLCGSDCDAWFEECKDDYTCSDNWGKLSSWNWTKTGNECKSPCKTFKQYYNDSITFCGRLFNYSFKYSNGKPGKDCLEIWPNDTSKNAQVARLFARKALRIASKAPYTFFGTTLIVASGFLGLALNVFDMQ